MIIDRSASGGLLCDISHRRKHNDDDNDESVPSSRRGGPCFTSVLKALASCSAISIILFFFFLTLLSEPTTRVVVGGVHVATRMPLIGSIIRGARAQLNTCRTGTVTLETLEPATYVVGSTAYTFGFCNAVQPNTVGIQLCLTAGYVNYNNITASGVCTSNLNIIRSGLTIVDKNTSTYTVSDSSGLNVAVVTMLCNWSSTSITTASLMTPVSTSYDAASGVTTTRFALSSRAACPAGTYFCDVEQGIYCGGTLSCINGVCVDTQCTTMVPTYPVSIAKPADFISLMKVVDCRGTPVSNLTRSFFTITMAGRPVDDPVYLGEASLVFEPSSPQSSIGVLPQVTTLLLDQSNSVVGYYEERLVEAAVNMTKRIMSANRNNRVAVVIFDGSASTYVLQSHTTNETAVLAALDALPLSTKDRQSTNLNGALISTMRDAYQMKFSFEGVNASDVFSSVVLFTDGYDTSGRYERSQALEQAAALGANITVLSVGIANTSDTSLLTSISNGYAAFADGIGGIADAFEEITDRLVSVSQNYYNVLFCMPMRGSNVPVTIGLNRTTFPNAVPLEFFVDASDFTSGCNDTHLRSQMLIPPNATNSVANAVLNASGGALTSLLGPQSAYFFEWGFDSGSNPQQEIVVTPVSSTVYYLMVSYDPNASSTTSTTTTTATTTTTTTTTTSATSSSTTLSSSTASNVTSTVTSTATTTTTTTPTTVPPTPTAVPPAQAFSSPRCVLSPYCYDGVFNTSFLPIQGATYKAFAVNALTFPSTIPSVSPTPWQWDGGAGWVKTAGSSLYHQLVDRQFKPLHLGEPSLLNEKSIAKNGNEGENGIVVNNEYVLHGPTAGKGVDSNTKRRGAVMKAAATVGDLFVTIKAIDYMAPTTTTTPPSTTSTTFPTFSPLPTTSTAATTSALVTGPSTIPPKDFFTVYSDPSNLSLASDLDLPATIILAVYFFIFTFFMLFFLFQKICTDPETLRTGGGRGGLASPPRSLASYSSRSRLPPLVADGSSGEPLALMMKEMHEPLVLRSEYEGRRGAASAAPMPMSSLDAAAAVGSSMIFTQDNPYAAHHNDYNPLHQRGRADGDKDREEVNTANPIDSYFPSNVVPRHHQGGGVRGEHYRYDEDDDDDDADIQIRAANYKNNDAREELDRSDFDSFSSYRGAMLDSPPQQQQQQQQRLSPPTRIYPSSPPPSQRHQPVSFSSSNPSISLRGGAAAPSHPPRTSNANDYREDYYVMPRKR